MITMTKSTPIIEQSSIHKIGSQYDNFNSIIIKHLIKDNNKILLNRFQLTPFDVVHVLHANPLSLFDGTGNVCIAVSLI